MNVKPLLKYFPEIHHLAVEQQVALLLQADQITRSPENKLRIWRTNMVGLLALIAITYCVIAFIGPALKLSTSATGISLMVVIFPLFIYLQHRRHIGLLHAALLQIAQQNPNIVLHKQK